MFQWRQHILTPWHLMENMEIFALQCLVSLTVGIPFKDCNLKLKL